ncbi:MAG: hypothetical protein WCV62_00510 [Candidatus Peribacteraceae bacterium]
MVRQVEEFGRGIGLIHEVIVTGRKVGAGRAFYVALAHNENLFRRVVEFVSQDPLLVDQQALLDAAARGVTFENGVFRFFDPGTPLNVLSSMPVVREKHLVNPHNLFKGYDWAKRADAPQERTFRVIEGSFGESFLKGGELLHSDQERPSTRSVVAFLVINALATGERERLLPECYVCTADMFSGGYYVCVGYFDVDGIQIGYSWNGRGRPDVAHAASRKS